MSSERFHRLTGKTPREPLLTEQLARRATEILDDGKPHSLEVVIADLSGLVPPGIAHRRNETDRKNSSGRAGKRHPRGEVPARAHDKPAANLIRSGARSIVRETLNGSVAFVIEDGPRDRGKQVRLVGLPRVVRGDRMRQQWVEPVLEGLAEALLESPWAVEQVRIAAHNNGFHLRQCPRGCQLGGPRHDEGDLEN